MSYYDDIYLKRLNRYGNTYQDRIMGQRQRDFDEYLTKSTNRVDFMFEGKKYPASFERRSQNNTETLRYLLTKLDFNPPSGTILQVPDRLGIEQPWMIYWLDDAQERGYNKYVMLKMTHYITWEGRDGIKHSAWGYLYGQEDNMLKDELRSRSRMDTYYTENLKMSFFVTPLNLDINKDDYIEIDNELTKEAYRVVGFDRQSTKGVEYVTIDPIYIFDQTPPPERQPEDSVEDFFWLQGGAD